MMGKRKNWKNWLTANEVMEYPTRCKIIDTTGVAFLGLPCGATPEESLPHIGKEGTAEELPDGRIKITLDDGNVIYGSNCWWVRT